MKDLNFFTTENGVASLILREIPYQGCAYVRLQDSRNPEALLEECMDFCRMCGAEHIYAAGVGTENCGPLHTSIYEMRCDVSALTDTDVALWPVLRENLSAWREIYNRKIKAVPNGAWMTEEEGEKMLSDGGGYFVHRDGTLLGIGRISQGEILWVASVQPGAGRDIVSALAGAQSMETVKLTVASANAKAVALYERLGFIPGKELSRWYKIL